MSPRALQRRSERGAALPFVMVMAVALVGFAGISYDAGNLFAERREAHNIAAAAARKGAGDVTEESVRAQRPELARSAAATARAFVDAAGARGSVATRPPDLVEVTVELDVEMEFLGLFGARSRTVTGSAIARVEGTRRE